MATIKFKFFETTKLDELTNRLENFVRDNKIEKNDIVRMDNHSTTDGKVIVNKVMLVYETPEKEEYPETDKILAEVGKTMRLKKNSGPRTGMKRGPYKKTLMKRKKGGGDVTTTTSSSSSSSSNTDSIYGGTKALLGGVVPGVIISPPATAENNQGEKKYYEGLNMVVVAPRKPVSEEDADGQ